MGGSCQVTKLGRKMGKINEINYFDFTDCHVITQDRQFA